MKATLNKLALLAFTRKARKLSKNISVVNSTSQQFITDFLVRAGETLIVWSEENGFHSISTSNDCMYKDLVHFPAKYDNDEVHYYGVLNKGKTTLNVYRCYAELVFRKKVYALGLKFFSDEESHEESLDDYAS